MELKYTDQLYTSRFIFIYGGTGSGKTKLLKPALEEGMNPIVGNTDRGLVTLREIRVPYYDITSIAEMEWFVKQVESGAFNQHHLVFLDDASELSSIVLAELWPKHKNNMQAYREMADLIKDWLKRLRKSNFPGYIVIVGKLDKVQDNLTGTFHFGPMFEGRVLSNEVKYMFDEVYYLEAGQDPNTATPENPSGFWNSFRTQRDAQYDCKSRANCLNLWETANLPHVFRKMQG